MPSQKPIVALAFLVTAVLAAQTAVLWQSRSTEREADLAGLRADVKAVGQAVAQSQKRLDRIEEQTARAASIAADWKEWVQSQEARQAAEAVAAKPTAPAPAPATEEGAGAQGGIPEVLERLTQMEKKLEKRPGGGGGEQWKPSLAEMTEELKLDTGQERGVASIANEAKDKLMELARIRRADGGSFLEELADAAQAALTDPAEAQKLYGTMLLRLMAEKVPGREATYFTEVVNISNDAHRGFKSALTPEQYRELSARNVDVFSISTGYDPIGDYAAAKWGRAK